MGLLEAHEVNTGGGSMVTIIKSSEWRNYILVTSDEAVAIYQSEDDFWDGEAPLESTYIKT